MCESKEGFCSVFWAQECPTSYKTPYTSGMIQATHGAGLLVCLLCDGFKKHVQIIATMLLWGEHLW